MFERKRRRKGQIFVIMIVISVTAALISSYVLLSYLFADTSKDTRLGTYQSGMIDALSDGDKALLFVDQTSGIAAQKGFLEYIEGAEINPDADVSADESQTIPDCGRYIYKLWNNEYKNCYPYPDYKDIDPYIMKNLMSITTSQSSNPYISYFKSILSKNINYELKYSSTMQGTQINGYAGDDYAVNIFRNNEVKSDKKILDYTISKNEWSSSDGDIKGIPFVSAASGHYYTPKTAKKIKYIVLHYTAGESIASAMTRFTNPAEFASSNYIVGSTNDNYKIIEPVKDSDVAYHAGCLSDQIYTDKCVSVPKKGAYCADSKYANINAESIGIEIVNLGFDCDQHDACKKDAIFKNNKYWQIYPDDQMKKVAELSAILIKKYNIDKKNIISHSDITRCKSDPGDAFDWITFNNYLDEALDKIDSSSIESTSYSINGAQADKTACPKASDVDWQITKVTLDGGTSSATSDVIKSDFTSDQTMKISMEMTNHADCINMKSDITISSDNTNVLKAPFRKVSDTSSNVFKETTKVPYTTVDAITCKFTTQPGIASAEQQRGNCVLAVPLDGKSVTYKINVKASSTNIDESKDSSDKSKSFNEMTITARKGSSDSFGQSAGATIDENSGLTEKQLNTVKVTKERLEKLDVMDYIQEISKKNGVDYQLVLGLITRESAGDMNAGSSEGAKGLMQVMKGTFDGIQFSDKCSWEEYQTDAKCQIRAGIAALKNKYDGIKDKIIYYKCSKHCETTVNGKKTYAACTNTCPSSKCIGPVDKSYTEWKAALRRYNGGGWTDEGTIDDSGCSGQPDYEYVENVLTYAKGWGYVQSSDGMIKEEVQKGILGTYSIKPSFKTSLNFDLTLLKNLTDFAKETSDQCAEYKGDSIAQCLKDRIDKFNSQVSKQYREKGIAMVLTTECEDDSTVIKADRLAEDIMDCSSSSDDNCVCQMRTNDLFIRQVSNDADHFNIQFRNSNSEDKSIRLDLNIKNPDNTLWDQTGVNAANIALYKADSQIYYGGVLNDKFCTPNRNKYELCLKTGYTYLKYDETKGKAAEDHFRIPFAIMIHDKAAPKPVKGLTAENMKHSKNSIILSWDSNTEKDVVKYNIYSSSDKQAFSSPTEDFKAQVLNRTASSVKGNFYEYQNLDYSNPTCRIQESSGSKYCIFEYNAVDMEGASSTLELEKHKLYFINSTKRFVYILDGNDAGNSLTAEEEKSIVVIASDVSDNEINNVDEDQKIEDAKNIVSITPHDLLEMGFVSFTGTPQQSVDTNSLSLSWEDVQIYMDGTQAGNIVSTNENIKYDVYTIQGSCPDESVYSIYMIFSKAHPIEGMQLKKEDVSGTSTDIDVSSDIGDICIAITAKGNNGVEYPETFTKNIRIDHPQQNMNVQVI